MGIGCACADETHRDEHHDGGWTCIFAVANKISERAIKENRPIYQDFDDTLCHERCPYLTSKPVYSNFETTCRVDQFDNTEWILSDDKDSLSPLGLFINENGQCVRCNELNPYCFYCSEEDYEVNTCDLCYRWDLNPVAAFTPNAAIHDYETKCTLPDCVDNVPGTEECNECNWFNWSQLSADLGDQNPDNDFLSIPYLADEYFYGSFLMEFIPKWTFLEPIDKTCVMDC